MIDHNHSSDDNTGNALKLLGIAAFTLCLRTCRFGNTLTLWQYPHEKKLLHVLHIPMCGHVFPLRGCSWQMTQAFPGVMGSAASSAAKSSIDHSGSSPTISGTAKDMLSSREHDMPLMLFSAIPPSPEFSTCPKLSRLELGSFETNPLRVLWI